MMTPETIWNRILSPAAEYDRTEALRLLLALQRTETPPEMPPEVVEALETHITSDRLQAALIGLILESRIEQKLLVPFAVVLRIFPIVADPFEPELIRQAVEALRKRSPEHVYRKAVLLTADPAAPPLDSHYANAVVSAIRFEELPRSFDDYLPPWPKEPEGGEPSPASGG